jgi:hypothetical protein
MQNSEGSRANRGVLGPLVMGPMGIIGNNFFWGYGGFKFDVSRNLFCGYQFLT